MTFAHWHPTVSHQPAMKLNVNTVFECNRGSGQLLCFAFGYGMVGMYCNVNVCAGSPVVLISRFQLLLTWFGLSKEDYQIFTGLCRSTLSFSDSEGERERGANEESHQPACLELHPKYQGSLGNDLNSAVPPSSTFFFTLSCYSDVPARNEFSFEQRHTSRHTVSAWQFRDNPTFSGHHDWAVNHISKWKCTVILFSQK